MQRPDAREPRFPLGSNRRFGLRVGRFEPFVPIHHGAVTPTPSPVVAGAVDAREQDRVRDGSHLAGIVDYATHALEHTIDLGAGGPRHASSLDAW